MKKILQLFLALCIAIPMTTPAQALVNGIFLGSNQDGVNVISNDLAPDSEYYFPILVAMDGTPPIQVTTSDLDRNHLVARIGNDSNGLDTVDIIQEKGLAYLYVRTNGGGTTTRLTGTIPINYRSKDSKENVTMVPTVHVDYHEMDQDTMDDLSIGDFLTVPSDSPVITKEQLAQLSSLNNHKAVTLAGSGWRYKVSLADVEKVNMSVNYTADMALTSQYPDCELSFINFPGLPDFGVTGELTLDVTSVMSEDTKDFYLYRNAYDTLFPLKYEYDKDNMEITIKTNLLSRYVISDKPLTTPANQSADIMDDSASHTSIKKDVPPTTIEKVVNPETGMVKESSGLLLAFISVLGFLGVWLYGVITSNNEQ